jgi:hypothetical protein
MSLRRRRRASPARASEEWGARRPGRGAAGSSEALSLAPEPAGQGPFLVPAQPSGMQAAWCWCRYYRFGVDPDSESAGSIVATGTADWDY